MALALALVPLAGSGSLVLAQKAHCSSFMVFSLALVIGSVDLPLTGGFGFGSGLTALALLLLLFYFGPHSLATPLALGPSPGFGSCDSSGPSPSCVVLALALPP